MNELVIPTNFNRLSLVKQCDFLGIQLVEHKLKRMLSDRAWILDDGSSFIKPEKAALAIMRKYGYEGSLCEGGAILTLMKASCLDYLSKINIFNDRMDACLRYFEAQCAIYQDHADKIINEILRCNENTIKINFEEIYSYSFIQGIYPSLDTEIITGIWKALGPDRLSRIADIFIKKPYQYRSGWPDLTLYNNNEFLLAEVKTSDKLHKSQVLMISEMGVSA